MSEGLSDREQGAAPQPPRVLVVDDDVMIVELIRKAIPAATIEGFAEAAPALERASNITFDAIFFDLLMPGMAGLDFFAALERIQMSAARSRVLMTGYVIDSELRSRADAFGLVLLQKPFRLQALYALLPADMRPGGVC